MKSQTPIIWDRKPNLNKLVDGILKEIRVQVQISGDPALKRAMEDLQGDPDLDDILDDETIASWVENGTEFAFETSPEEIKDLIKKGEAQNALRVGRISGQSRPESAAFSYTREATQEDVDDGLAGEVGEEIEEESSVEQVFDDLGKKFGRRFGQQAASFVSKAMKSGELQPQDLFNPNNVVIDTNISTSGLPGGETMLALSRLKPSYGERSKEKGKGEMLASVMFGFVPGVAEPDIVIPGKGGWHVKGFGDRSVVPSGEAGPIGAASKYVWKRWWPADPGKNIAMGALDKKAKEIRGSHPELEEEFWDDVNAVATISISQGADSRGMLSLVGEDTFRFIPKNKIQSAGWGGGRLQISKNPLPDSLSAKFTGSSKSETPQAAVSRVSQGVDAAQYYGDPPRLAVAAGFRRKNQNLLEKVERILSIDRALNEELTRADKKDIDKMIAKRIEKDRTEQKRQFKIHLAEELKSSKFQKTILEMAKDEMGRELKGKQLESAVLEITKKVIKKLYRELSYSYNPMIDRIKL